MSIKKYNKSDIFSLDKPLKINLINSITGLKPANLIGTKSKNIENIAIFSSVVHLGSNPPHIGFIIRPQYKRKTDTYLNLLDNPYFSINSIQNETIEKAHKTSNKYNRDISEFDQLEIEKIYIDDYNAPFVKNSSIKIGLKKIDEIVLPNRCKMIIGEVELIIVDRKILDLDGNIDYSKSTFTCISGLQNYYNVELSRQMKRGKS